MTTPYNPLFEVRLKTREGDRALTRFTRDPARLGEGAAALAAVENQDISLLFRAPPDFRLTMDGLDVVSVPGAERMGDTPALLPRNDFVPLFEAKNFPLVPGYYVVTVTGRGRSWYSAVEILPRYLEKRQWQAMRDELMGEIRRLSFDFMKRTMHIDQPLENALGLSSAMLLRFYIIEDMGGRVGHLAEELAHTANSRLTLAPYRLPRGVPADPHSVSLPAAVGRVLKKETTWDVAENRFAKAVLTRLDRSLRQFLAALEENEARVAAEQEENKKFKKDYQYRMRGEAERRFGEYRTRAMRLRASIRRAEEAPWFSETKTVRAFRPAKAAVRDPRYAVLYRLHRRLLHPEDSLSVSPFYRFQWKRTDKLYELWCFLTFVKAFGKNGWTLEKGPAVTDDGERYILESLEPGTTLILARGEEEAHLVYDALVPDTAAATDRFTAPLYTNNAHRRPDMRIDYYRNGEYAGSLVADFKYRDIVKLWSEGNSPELRVQFNAYRDMNTKFYRGMDETESLRNSRPVKEVWAVFPRETPPLSDEDYSLRFISLAPGLSANEKLPELLETYFGELRIQN